MIEWRIYYDGGSTFDSSQGEPDDAPAWGVLVVLQRAADRRMVDILIEANYYSHDGERWQRHDKIGLLDRLVNRVPFSGLLVGRYVSDELWIRTLRLARNDEDFFGQFTRDELNGC